MKRIDKVHNSLIELDSGYGVTTKEISDFLNISRCNVSYDLNLLYKLKKVEKFPGRPIKYRNKFALNITHNCELDSFLKVNPSLSETIEKAKASILYPPSGIHCLILGETGSGKSLLSSLMYKYGTSIGAFKSDAPFITFNCADYSTNSQLLTSQLFGVKKGTYTGCTEDRGGLLEKANNGILFLDEVHSLSNEGQEMLFTFMDTGKFTRLGEVAIERTSKVLIICATNQDPNSSLLNTFIRRIPMIINIPNLKNRTYAERMYLIENFFMEECRNIKNNIYVSSNTLKCLLSYNCKNNIGQLRTDIKLICAKAYTDYLINNKRTVKINSPDLPVEIRNSLISFNSLEDFKNILKNDTYYVFSSNHSPRLYYNPKDNFLSDYDMLISELTTKQNLTSLQNSVLNYIFRLIDTYHGYRYEIPNYNFLFNLCTDIDMKLSKTINLIIPEDYLVGFIIHLSLIHERLRYNVLSDTDKIFSLLSDNTYILELCTEIIETLEIYFNMDIHVTETLILTLLILKIKEIED